MNAQSQWVDRFVSTLNGLAAIDAPEQHRALACELYPDLNTLPAEVVARTEWEAWSAGAPKRAPGCPQFS